MPLDPQLEVMLPALNALVEPENMTVEALRAAIGDVAGSSVTPLAVVRDISIPASHGVIPARLYRPVETGILPLLVFYHGGGFVIGGLDGLHDEMCRRLALAADCAVLAVDYRLAPEHRFPAASDDAFAALLWAAGHCEELGADPQRIAVGGDSAGGNLSAVVALRARDEIDVRLVGQLLIYPCTAYHTPPTQSALEHAEGYSLTRWAIEWFYAQYLPDEKAAHHPHFAVLTAPNLEGLAPAHVITAEFDPLRDEGETYARRLREAGVPVEAIRYTGAIHGFFGFPGIDIGWQALVRAAYWLRRAFAA